MGTDSKGDEAGDADLVQLHDLVRRVVGARVRDAAMVDDLVQETLVRVLAARGRLDDGALAPYAVVTARNLVRTLAREDERRRRHSHRLFEDPTTPSPEEGVVQDEERSALALAWSKLGPEERRTLADHEIAGDDIAALAEESDSTPGAVAVRLSRTRARLRVEYLLALRRVELPTARCRSVLLAISARDQRRQQTLAVGEHLFQCECCASLSEPLLKRSRPLAALWPPLAGWELVKRLGRGAPRVGRWARSHPVHATGGASGLAVVAISIVLLTRPDTTWLRIGNRSLLPPPPASELSALASRPVEARSVTVQSVVTPTGFWVGTSQHDRVFVEMLATLPFPVTANQKVSFVGYVDPNHEDSAERYGLGGQGAAQLRYEGYHLHAEANALRKG
ncbi:MAG: RNA polymerase sigma factor [Acidimicrobiales bacterium]